MNRLKDVFAEMTVLKNPERTKFFADLSLPSYMRDWLVMKFSDDDGTIDYDGVTRYVKQYIPSREDYEQYKYQMVNGESVRFLARLANALMHRDYDVIGSEVHVDMFDDRLEISSPGGMADGTLIQECDIEEVLSTRRNPIIAEIFHRLDYIERRGSGLKKIRNETSHLYGYTDDYAPKFKSTPTSFRVSFRNMNYDLHGATTQDTTQDSTQVTEQDDRITGLLKFCESPRTRDEMQSHIGIANREHFRKSILKPLLDSGQLKMTLPSKPNSRNQKYIKP